MAVRFEVLALSVLLAVLPARLAAGSSAELASESVQRECGVFTHRILTPILQQLDEKGNQIVKLEDQIKELTADLQLKQQQLTTATETANQSKIISDDLSAKNVELTESLRFKDEQIASLQSSIKGCERNATDLGLEWSTCQQKLAETDAKLIGLQGQLDEVQQKLEHLAPNCVYYSNYTGPMTLQVEGHEPFSASCDAKVAGSGWTVIQRRINGKTDFYQTWNSYKAGFGDVQKEFWLGLEKLHLMTKDRRHELYIQLKDQQNEVRHARYDDFRIGSEQDHYKLISVGEYSGNAGDSLSSHTGRPFSTYDRDNDSYSHNCAKDVKGAWWFYYCGDSNLNGKRFDCNEEKSNKLENTGCIYWQAWHGRSSSLRFVQMMIRPVDEWESIA